MRLIASPDTNNSLTKRTRVVGTQSKYGCFTCKSRRIKCDETKPECLRCERSDIPCEGYPLRAYSGARDSPYRPPQSASDSPETQLDAISTNETRPAFALLDGFRRSPTQDRLARIGCGVLQDGLHDQFEVSRTVFECLLPQLSHALPSVNAAAAALGAVYEMQTAPAGSLDSKKLLVAAQYGAAVREVQRELRDRPYGAVPILVACVLLACADVLLCRMRLALLHVRGAMRLLEERNGMSADRSTSRPAVALAATNDPSPSPSSTESLALEEDDDELTVFFRTLDVQTVSYADSLPPEMHVALIRPLPYTASSSPCIHRTGRELIALIQACYCFTSYALQYTYRPRVFVSTDLLIEQGRHIAALKLWLRRLDCEVLPSIKASAYSTSAALSKYMHCLLLRNLCLSAIIYTSEILDPYETGWDAYAREFQEIITAAELILKNRLRKRPDAQSSSTSAFTFTPSPGIIQPLYMTVLKYRHPRWRRRALEIIRQSGKEGPWDGRLMAAAAQRAIIQEESELVRDRSSSMEVEQADGCEEDGKVRLEVIVPERLRISGCGPDNGPDDGDAFSWEWMKEWEYTNHQGAMGMLKVNQVRLCRCKDVDKMLLGGLDWQIPQENAAWWDEHWERWTEPVEL